VSTANLSLAKILTYKMFQKIEHTRFPPNQKPVLVWDGECGFCKYWVTRWKKISNGAIDFEPYQIASEQFQDIPVAAFKKASRLITTSGSVHSGPDSAYMSYYIANPKSPWHSWYERYSWFRRLSDIGYNFVAKHRSTMFTITVWLLGKNPISFKHYWIIYLLVIGTFIFLLLKFL